MENLNNILNWFAANGMPLEFFPEDKEFRALYQFDGGLDGVVVQFHTGTNVFGEPGIFGDITLPSGRSFDISCPQDSWLEDMVPWVKMAIHKP